MFMKSRAQKVELTRSHSISLLGNIPRLPSVISRTFGYCNFRLSSVFPGLFYIPGTPLCGSCDRSNFHSHSPESSGVGLFTYLLHFFHIKESSPVSLGLVCTPWRIWQWSVLTPIDPREPGLHALHRLCHCSFPLKRIREVGVSVLMHHEKNNDMKYTWCIYLGKTLGYQCTNSLIDDNPTWLLSGWLRCFSHWFQGKGNYLNCAFLGLFS